MTTPNSRWLALVYGSLFIPFVGPLLLAVVSSILYSRWRKTDPERVARSTGTHGSPLD